MSDKLRLRVDFRLDWTGQLKPVLVNVADGKILSQQTHCIVEGGVDGLAKVTVTMWIDGDDVAIGIIGIGMGDTDESNS